MENKSFDYFNILTKKQIIEFCKHEYFFSAPDKKSVKFFLYNIKTNENIKKMDAYNIKQSGSTIGKDIDDLGIKFNKETDLDKRLSILKEREKLLKKMKSDNDYFSKLIDESEKIGKLLK